MHSHWLIVGLSSIQFVFLNWQVIGCLQQWYKSTSGSLYHIYVWQHSKHPTWFSPSPCCFPRLGDALASNVLTSSLRMCRFKPLMFSPWLFLTIALMSPILDVVHHNASQLTFTTLGLRLHPSAWDPPFVVLWTGRLSYPSNTFSEWFPWIHLCAFEIPFARILS